MYSITATPRHLCGENRDFEQVFKKYGITAASNTPLNVLFKEPSLILALLESLDAMQPFSVERYSRFSTVSIIDYLEHSHRFYLDVWLPEITHLLQHLVQITGDAHPMLRAIPAFWRSYRLSLQSHFQMEEKGLFPFARAVHTIQTRMPYLRIPLLSQPSFSFEQFKHDHEDESAELIEIRSLLLNYVSRENASFPYRILLHKMRLFEQDLSLHAFLEDAIVVPRLIDERERMIIGAN